MKAKPSLKYLFPWRNRNRFELLVDGQRFFPRMLKAIEAARRHVLLEIYLFESGTVATRFIDALTRAAGRGVTVRLLLDDFGARGLSRPDRERLVRGGVQLVFYNPLRFHKHLRNMFRDHRKLMVVDGELAFVGGTGITDDFDMPGHPERSWRETAVRAQGPVVADWQALFRRVWNRHAPKPLVLPRAAPPAVAEGMPGRVTVTSALARQEIKRSLYSRARRAEQRLWIATAYFVPSRKLRRVLADADRRDVDVRLLLPGAHIDHPGVRHAGRRFTKACCRPECAFSSTSRGFCTPRPCCATTGCRSARAISTAGTCAGTSRPTRKWMTPRLPKWSSPCSKRTSAKASSAATRTGAAVRGMPAGANAGGAGWTCGSRAWGGARRAEAADFSHVDGARLAGKAG